MCDFLALLPDELFIQVIFPKLVLQKVIELKQVSKRYKALVEDYQQEYSELIFINYDRVHLLENKLPKGNCSSFIYVTDKVRSITPYKILTHLTISFVKHDRFLNNDNSYHAELYTYAENLDYFDMSNLCDLRSLSMLNIFNYHRILSLPMLTKLVKLELLHSNFAVDLSSLVNLEELYIMNCPNITSFPAHLKMYTYTQRGGETIVCNYDIAGRFYKMITKLLNAGVL